MTTVTCPICGDDASCCPTCNGGGEVVCADERAYRRQWPLTLDPPDAFGQRARCRTCRGTGKHTCAEHRCDCCGRAGTTWSKAEGLHLCVLCADGT